MEIHASKSDGYNENNHENKLEPEKTIRKTMATNTHRNSEKQQQAQLRHGMIPSLLPCF
jgi:hypothetical protein